MDTVRSGMEIGGATDLGRSKHEIEKAIQVDQMDFFFHRNLPNGLAIGFQFKILGTSKILMDNRRSEKVEVSLSRDFKLPNHLSHQSRVSL